MPSALLRPALAPLDHLRVSAKFSIITLMFFLSAAVPVHFMMKGQNRIIAAATREGAGLRLLKPLSALARHVVDHRLGVAAAQSEARKAEVGHTALRILKANVDDDLARLAAARKADDTILVSESKLQALVDRWTALQGLPDGAGKVRAHDTLTREILALNAQVLDSSGLILDGDLACSYVIDLTVMKLPEQMGQTLALAGLAQDAAAGRNLEREEKTAMERQIGSIQQLLDAGREAMGPSKGFSSRQIALRLASLVQAHGETTTGFLKRVSSLLMGEHGDTSREALDFAERETLASGFGLQEASLRVLEDQLQARIRTFRREQRLALGGSLAAALLAFYLLAALYAGLQAGLGAMKTSLEAVAGGDLTVRANVASRDEIGVLATHLDRSMTSLQRMVERIQATAHTIQGASAEIAQASADLSQRTEAQAASLVETAASMEQISTTAAQAGKNAKSAAGDVQRMDGLILGCREAVERVGATIHDIQTSSRRMVDVTGVVDTVAFQANLLAVDAVITAAGGDRERGFSALAAQVHGLGQRSADAAREIKTLIEDTLALIHASGAGTSQAQAAVTGLTEDLRQITAFITDITYSAEEQAAGITQISQALGEMEQITQRNAALVVQTSAAAGALAGEAATLDTLVRAFRTGALTPPDAAAPPTR